MTGLIKTILIVDDNRGLYEELKENFNINNIGIKITNNIDVLKKILINDYLYLIIIDTDKLLVNNIDILKYIRTKSNVPIIFISSVDAIFDKILAFNMGVDDYIVKPFDFRELVVRSKAIIRRYDVEEKNIKNNIIKFDNLIIDISSYKVTCENKELKMPPKEFELLYYLALNQGMVFSREELLHKVWGYNYLGDSRTVDVHIKRLREKLSFSEKCALNTVWGVGYKFELKDSQNQRR